MKPFDLFLFNSGPWVRPLPSLQPPDKHQHEHFEPQVFNFEAEVKHNPISSYRADLTHLNHQELQTETTPSQVLFIFPNSTFLPKEAGNVGF